MLGRNLLPSLWKDSSVPERRETEQPFYSMQKEMNRLFDDFFRGFDASPFGEENFGKFSPAVDIRENEKEMTIQVELPGMDEKDVEVLLTDNALTIKGEKKEEKEDKGKDHYHMERIFGFFQRVISLPPGIDSQNTEAKFKKGILRITLPKLEETKIKGKKIAIASD
jgi:HSP20 family protein